MLRPVFLILVLVVLSLVGCDDNRSGPKPGPEPLTISCPGDTVIPINCPSDPESLDLLPVTESDCMDNPAVSYSDSFIPGGIVRTWTVTDTCANVETCVQHIGRGAPLFLHIVCPNDTVIPINCPSHPDSLGLFPTVESCCPSQPVVSFYDSILIGGIMRIWVATDTCDAPDTCIQGIGQGAPGPCE